MISSSLRDVIFHRWSDDGQVGEQSVFSIQCRHGPPLAATLLLPFSLPSSLDAATLLKADGLQGCLWRRWWGVNVHALLLAEFGAECWMKRRMKRQAGALLWRQGQLQFFEETVLRVMIFGAMKNGMLMLLMEQIPEVSQPQFSQSLLILGQTFSHWDQRVGRPYCLYQAFHQASFLQKC